MRYVTKADQVHKHHYNPNGNAGIGNIESRPMVTSHEEIQEVDHFLVQDTVNQVADGAAKYQDQRHLHGPSFAWSLMKKYENGYDGYDRKTDKQNGLQLGSPFGKKTKGYPRIADMGNRKKTINNDLKMVLGNMSGHQQFRVLIQNDQNVGNQK